MLPIDNNEDTESIEVAGKGEAKGTSTATLFMN
jgi:hypothetical protein